MKNRNDGFTTVELLMAIATSFIIIGFIYSAYYFSLRITKSWNEKIYLENNAMLCIDRLTNDLVNASEIVIMKEDTLLLLSNDGQFISYKYQNQNLYRNGFQINDQELRIPDLSIHVIKPEVDQTYQEIYPKLVIGIEITMANNRKQIALTSGVHPRNITKGILNTL